MLGMTDSRYDQSAQLACALSLTDLCYCALLSCSSSYLTLLAQIFYIVAAVDLPSEDSSIRHYRECSRTGYEHVLATVKAYGNGTFVMKVRHSPPPPSCCPLLPLALTSSLPPFLAAWFLRSQ